MIEYSLIREVNMEKETAFTEEQVRELAENRYTYRVSRKSITFTPEFMRLLCGKKAEGMSNRKIFEDCGYDPDVLGRYRMSNAVRKIRRRNAAPFVYAGGFSGQTLTEVKDAGF